MRSKIFIKILPISYIFFTSFSNFFIYLLHTHSHHNKFFFITTQEFQPSSRALTLSPHWSDIANLTPLPNRLHLSRNRATTPSFSRTLSYIPPFFLRYGETQRSIEYLILPCLPKQSASHNHTPFAREGLELLDCGEGEYYSGRHTRVLRGVRSSHKPSGLLLGCDLGEERLD